MIEIETMKHIYITVTDSCDLQNKYIRIAEQMNYRRILSVLFI